jgi:hypothetical protein
VRDLNEYLILLCLCLGGCAAFKQTAKTVNDAAAILCQGAFGVEEEAARRGVSVEELCRMHDVLKPFVDEALKAQHAAAEKAGVSR